MRRPAAHGHPRTAYLPERLVEPALDAWIATLFDPEELDRTATALAAAATQPSLGETARRAAAHTRLADATAALGDVPALLAHADPADKAELYRLLNVTLVWDPTTRTATAEAGVATTPDNAATPAPAAAGPGHVHL